MHENIPRYVSERTKKCKVSGGISVSASIGNRCHRHQSRTFRSELQCQEVRAASLCVLVGIRSRKMFEPYFRKFLHCYRTEQTTCVQLINFSKSLHEAKEVSPAPPRTQHHRAVHLHGSSALLSSAFRPAPLHGAPLLPPIRAFSRGQGCRPLRWLIMPSVLSYPRLLRTKRLSL